MVTPYLKLSVLVKETGFGPAELFPSKAYIPLSENNYCMRRPGIQMRQMPHKKLNPAITSTGRIKFILPKAQAICSSGQLFAQI